MTSGEDLTNLGQIATRTIQYNADNMPTSITHSVQGTTSFTYDGDNARAKKVYGSTSTYYLSPDFEIKKQGASTDYIKYIFAGNLRVASVSSLNGTYYFHKDHLGSSTAMTNSSGSVSETTEYRPFGSKRAHTGSTISNYKFTDQELDPESGLYNYDARLYDPVIGRFISADNMTPDWYNPQYLNRYTYCRNNPLVYVDPSGHCGVMIGPVVEALGIDEAAAAAIGDGGSDAPSISISPKDVLGVIITGLISIITKAVELPGKIAGSLNTVPLIEWAFSPTDMNGMRLEDQMITEDFLAEVREAM